MSASVPLKYPVLYGCLGIVVLVVVLIFSSLFQVTETQQVLILQFGQPIRTIDTPGLAYKIPFIQDRIVFEKRMLPIDPPARQILLEDQKRIDVDSYARYRIKDPLLFYKTVQTEEGFTAQFDSILDSIIRKTLGSESMANILSPQRRSIMATITKVAQEAGLNYGVEVVAVRIGRTDLPENISRNVYERMRVEREREANLLRAEGDEEKQRIMSEADKQKITILAEAQQKARQALGEGMGRRNRLLSAAAAANPDLFRFFRSMEAYEKALDQENTTFILSPKSGFLRYMSQ